MKAKSTKILVIVAFVLLVVVGAVFALGRYGKIGASMLADRPRLKQRWFRWVIMVVRGRI